MWFTPILLNIHRMPIKVSCTTSIMSVATARWLVGPTPFPLVCSSYKSFHFSVDVRMSAEHPSLEIMGGARDRFVPSLTQLSRPYKPFPLLGWNCHVETIFAAFFRSTPDVELRRECLRTEDGGSVALDWVSGDDRRLPPDAPLVILLVRSFVCLIHFTGSFTHTYY